MAFIKQYQAVEIFGEPVDNLVESATKCPVGAKNNALVERNGVANIFARLPLVIRDVLDPDVLVASDICQISSNVSEVLRT